MTGIKKEQGKRTGVLPLFFLAFVFVGGIVHFLMSDFSPEKNKPISQDCLLSYGQWACINSRVVIPFHNSGKKTVSFTSVSVPVSSGQNIYNVQSPLLVGETKTLSTASCSSLLGKTFSLKWCCETDCYSVKMDKPSDKITFKESVSLD